ncbi:MAG TPA: hypothetical protein VMH81_30885 [Bryobacteraceae bacterium]|nr:hypothetical protein [Bryobacteraceae bacterium]
MQLAATVVLWQVRVEPTDAVSQVTEDGTLTLKASDPSPAL